MGRKEIEALIKVLEGQLAAGRDSVVTGTWTIIYSREREAFFFDKCEMGGYCEERPSVIGIDGTVKDRGGPLLEQPTQGSS